MIGGKGFQERISGRLEYLDAALCVEGVSAGCEFPELTQEGRRMSIELNAVVGDVPSRIELQAMMSGPVNPIQHQKLQRFC